MKTILTFPLPSGHSYLKLLYSSLSENSYHIFYLDKLEKKSGTRRKNQSSHYEGLKGIDQSELENQTAVYQSLVIHNRFRFFDIVHFHWIEYIYMPHNTLIGRVGAVVGFMLLSLYMKYIVRNKIVITFHNVESHKKLNPKLERLLFKYCITIADAVIVHNRYSKKRLLSLYDESSTHQKKMHIIPHGHYLSYYPRTVSPQDARGVLGIPKHAFVLLIFGEMRPSVKGIEDIIAIAKKRENLPKNAYIIFAGRSKDARLRKRIQIFCSQNPDRSQCHLRYVSDDDVQLFLNASDVGLLPYQSISTSGSLMLYMSFRIPVVISDLPPIREILSDTYPFYCKPGDTSSIEKAIHKAYSTKPADRNALYEDKITCYNWKEIALKTETVYESLFS